MARYPRILLVGEGTLPPFPDDTPRSVEIVVLEHENTAESRVLIHGAGLGAHVAELRFDDGDGRYSQSRTITWTGDARSDPLPFVPTAFIASIDACPEIRSERNTP